MLLALLVLAQFVVPPPPEAFKQRAFFLVDRNGDKVTCARWRVDQAGFGDGNRQYRFVREQHTAYWLVTTAANAKWDGSVLDVTGGLVTHAPRHPSVPQQPLARLCKAQRTRTEMREDRWIFTRGRGAESWFLTAAACEAAVKRGEAGLGVNECEPEAKTE